MSIQTLARSFVFAAWCQGVERFGAGKWATILEVFKFDDRTSVDLKGTARE